MNHVILVGRLTGTPEELKTDENVVRTVINLAVQRTFKNQDGLYDTDFIRCILWNGIAKRACEYCKKGDMVCVKGRLQVRSYQSEEETKYITEVVVETISFVSSVQKNHVEENNLEE